MSKEPAAPSPIDAVKAHFAAKLNGELRCIEVPEWGTDGAPLKVYYGPETPEIKDRYFSEMLAKKFSGFVRCLIARARTADGRPMFRDPDYITLMRNSDPDVVVRIVSQFGEDPEVSVDEAGKS